MKRKFAIVRGRLAAGVAALALVLGVAAAAGNASAQTEIESTARALQRASDSVVGIEVIAVDDARSASTLGRQRAGSGVVIGADGLVLTIGYLILEAERVLIVTDDGRRIPARATAYDVATGFGLVQALAPLKIDPVPLGESGKASREEPMVFVSGGEDGGVGVAQLVSRRSFSGYWEYHIDDALFTTPARSDHSGAGLFNARGELVGIGSLVVQDAAGSEVGRVPGNMFVPVDLLKPVLTELRERGSSRASERAWLGVNCVEQDGRVRIARVSDDSPADVAGLERGDLIVAVDGTGVNSLEQLWKRLWAGERAERAVVLDIERRGERQSVTVQAVDRAKTLRRAQGI